MPEVIVRRYLHQEGYRFRLHRKDLPGRPDIVLPKYNTLIFIHGCFWHQHSGCVKATMPKSNSSFWYDKLQRNILRDKENIKEIKRLKYKIITIWECELSKDMLDSTKKD